MILKMMKGLPASGKSTEAEKIVRGGGNWIRVNRDLIREMLHFNKWTPLNEGRTVDAEKELVKNFLSQGMNVIVDDTNLGQKHLDLWKNVAKEMQCKFEVQELDTHIADCIARDHERGDKVGGHVIFKMALEYDLVPELHDYKFVLIDIDGTIADCEHRRHHVQKDPKDWKSFFAEMDKDTPREDVIEQIEDTYSDEENIIPVFVTARPEDYREVTETWIRLNVTDNFEDPFIPMIMRGSGDTRPDTIVKQQMYDKYFKHYNVVAVFDDRPSVIEMWRSNGLEVIDVGNGEDF